MRYLLALLLLLALPAQAQQIDDDDGGRGFLAGLIEDALSDTSRAVRVIGFQGALSSRATVERIVVEDGEGPWLTITDAVLDWNRSALLRGRLEVEELVAARIEIARAPVPDPDVVPDSTAGGFAIPDLPVSVEIGRVAAERVDLGAPLLGEAASFSVEGSGTLIDGALDAAIEAQRVDGAPGTFRIAGAYNPQNRVVTVDVALQEEEGGIAATLLGLPGTPAVALTVAGEGPLNDFAATIDLDTDGADRLGGSFALLAEGESAAGPTRRFDLDLQGNIAPLVAPDLAEFFGDDLALRVRGAREPSGRLLLESLAVDAAALDLSGTAAIAADGLPERFDLDMTLGAGGEPVRLPLAAEVLVTDGALNATFDAEDGERWSLTGRVEGIDAEAADVALLTLEGGGTISRAGARAITADVALSAEGVAPADPALADALGETVALSARLAWDDESPVDIRAFVLDTGTAEILGTGSLTRGGEAIGPELTLDAELTAADLSRFAALAGVDLSGAAEVTVDGTVASTGGAFDLRVEGTAQDLAVGIGAADAVIGGRAEIVLDAARDEAGTTLREVRLRTEALALDASGTVSPETADLALNLTLDDLGRVAPQFEGPLALNGTADRADGRWTANLDASAPLGTEATVALVMPDEGTLTVDFDAQVARFGELVPQLPGAATLTGRAERSGEDWTVTADVAAPQGIEAAVEASLPADGPITATYDAEIADLAAFVPQLPGPATARGDARLQDGALAADLTLFAPEGIEAEIDLTRSAEGVLEADLDARIADLGEIVPQLPGPATAVGTVRQADGVLSADLDVTAPEGITATVEAVQDEDGRLTADYEARIADLSVFAPPLVGPATVNGTATLEEASLIARLDAAAPEGITATVDLRRDADGPLTAELDARLADLGAFVPQLEGPATATGIVRQEADGTVAEIDLRTEQGITAEVEATIPAEGPIRATYEAVIDDVGVFTEAVEGPARLTGDLTRDAEGVIETEARLTGPAGADLSGIVRLDGADVTADLAGTIARPGEIREGLPGPLDVEGTFARRDGTITADARIEAPGEDRVAFTAALPPSGEAEVTFDAYVARPDRFLNGLPGPLTAEGSATRDAQGIWQGEVDASAADGSTVTATGRYDPDSPTGRVEFDADITDLGRFVPQLPGGAEASGTATQSERGWQVDARVALADGSRANVSGLVPTEGDIGDVTFSAQIADLGRFVPQLPGSASARGTVGLRPEGVAVDVTASLADGSRLVADGILPAEGASGALNFDARLANLGRFVPQLQGPATATGTATRDGADYVVDARLAAPAATSATVTARIGADRQEATFDARVGDVSALVPRFPGAITAQGTAVRRGDEIDLDVDLGGTGGLSASVEGTLGQRLDVDGTVPLALANPFIRPRSLDGTATLDLAVEGAPALDAVSGTIGISNARLSIPRQRQSIEGIAGTITLNAGSAAFDIAGTGRFGGTVAIGGTANLAAQSFDVEIALRGVTLRDPLLYETTLDGDLAFTGSTTAGGTISGRIDLLETEVRLGDAPIGGTGAIPPITHIGDTAAVEATRARARLTETGGSEGTNRDGTPRNNAFALDILISAERRIFLRGRGLDAELGGTLQLVGTTANIIPIGQFDLIRGRIDILGRRLTLTEGSARLQGDFDPTVRLVATTQTDEGDVSVVVDGPISAPDITFESAAGLPEDEVLAQLIFGRGLQTLTPFQAARLASAVATLTGRGGGFLGGLRENFGLDDLDLTTAPDGTAALRFGTYLTENIYSDVTVDAEGEAALTLNLDLTENLTARGTVSSSGETGIGIFFERDY